MSNGTALLVIDAQVNLFAPESAVHDSEKLLNTLGWLIARARSADALVVYVQNNGGKGDPDQLGTPGWQIHPGLAPQAGDLVLQKSTSDPFHLTPLQKELTRREIKRLIIVGLQSEHSIEAACRRASALDYEVVLVGDGHSTRNNDKLPAADVIAAQNASLGAFAKVIGSSDVDFRQGLKPRRNFS